MGFEVGDTELLRRVAEALEKQNDLQKEHNQILRSMLELLKYRL